jgi:hypothetical protein
VKIAKTDFATKEEASGEAQSPAVKTALLKKKERKEKDGNHMVG